jgi:hypothetical protein
MSTSEQPEPDPATELTQGADEPLLPIEKHLIVWSLALGVGLLALLTWISHTFFAVPGASP